MEGILIMTQQKRYDNCVDCGEYTHIFGRDRCKKCHGKFWRNQPGWKENHAARMREERKNKPEMYKAIETRRQQTSKRINWRRKYQKEYYRDNPEVFLKAKKKWEDKHPGLWARYAHMRRSRERKLEYTLTDQEWEEIKKSHHYLCIYCGGQFDNLTRDHWIPLIKGGGFTKENIVPACGSCNSRKRDMTGDEFMELLDLQEWERMKMEFEKVCA